MMTPLATSPLNYRKVTFKSALLACLFGLALPAWAAHKPDRSCHQLTGFWQGHYQDPQHLFPNQHFPIQLYIQVKHHQLLGYTLPANDAEGAGFGISDKAYPTFLFGQCKHGKITQLYALRKGQKCFDPLPSQAIDFTKKTWQFQIPWDNAMISTVFQAKLKKGKQKQKVDLKQLDAVQNAANQTYPSCH